MKCVKYITSSKDKSLQLAFTNHSSVFSALRAENMALSMEKDGFEEAKISLTAFILGGSVFLISNVFYLSDTLRVLWETCWIVIFAALAVCALASLKKIYGTTEHFDVCIPLDLVTTSIHVTRSLGCFRLDSARVEL